VEEGYNISGLHCFIVCKGLSAGIWHMGMARKQRGAVSRAGNYGDGSLDLAKLGRSTYGDRWPALYKAMMSRTQHCALANRFSEGELPPHLQESEELICHTSFHLHR
jgi:hypothetical protein